MVLFGNRPPPFPEPKLFVSDELRGKLADKGLRTAWLAPQPGLPPTSSPAGSP